MKHAIFVLVLVAALPAQAVKRITAVIFPPSSSQTAGIELGYGIADLAGAALFESGVYNHIHLKQVLSMARHRGWSASDLAKVDQARAAATTVLGAPVGALGTLQKTVGGWRLGITAFDTRNGSTVRATVELPADAARAVQEGGVAVARAVAELDSIDIPKAEIHPRSGSAAAMGAYLSCHAALVRQPMGLRKSHVVDAGSIATARARCEKAVELDPGFVAAWAALSLASSLSMETQRATVALENTRGVNAYVPFAVLSQYWLATRFNSNAAGAVVLRDAVRNHPGALIYLTYLGEHLNITRKHSESLAAWNRYLAVVDHSPYALSQKGYSLARLGLHDDAVSISRQAVTQDPESLVVKLELASRLVDARMLDEATTLLETMIKDRSAWGEVFLRLGYVYLLRNNNRSAEKMLQRALKLATGPSEWRTRGRTRYDLAIVMARRGKLKQAENHLLAAAKEGFVVSRVLRDNADLKQLQSRPRVTHLFRDPSLKLDPKLLQVSPFPIDSGGSVRPDAERPGGPGFSF